MRSAPGRRFSEAAASGRSIVAFDRSIPPVTPAQAGAQGGAAQRLPLDSRLRGNDEWRGNSVYPDNAPASPHSKAAKTWRSAVRWSPSGDKGTNTGVRMPASRHAATPSRIFAGGPKSVESASQRSVR